MPRDVTARLKIQIAKYSNSSSQMTKIFYSFGVMPHCMVPSCTNGSSKTRESDVSYHRLPNDQQMRRKMVVRTYLRPILATFAAHILPPDCCETSLKETFGIKTKKSLKPGSVPSIFPFLYRKPEREMSHKRKQIREKIAKR